MKLYSFDVFNTIITRKIATPRGIFAIMQNELKKPEYGNIPASLSEDFFSLRIGAESISRKMICNENVQDVTLEQIYKSLVDLNWINDEQAEILCELERDIELDNVFPVLENIKLLKDLINVGERVVLISDMYLDEYTIRQMLSKVDEVFRTITIYVSSGEMKKNKYSGDLYEYIHYVENIEYKDWIHYGDNIHSDYDVPISRGISCILVQNANLFPAEENLINNREQDIVIQKMIGHSRMARLNRANFSEWINYTAYNYGCTYAGPILYPYAKWIVEEAVRCNISNLFFIARDGYIIKALVDSIIVEHELSLKTKLIYGSRLAWRIPTKESVKEDIIDIYKHSFEDRIRDTHSLAMFLGVGEEFVRDILRDNKLILQNEIMTSSEIYMILNAVLNDKTFIEALDRVYENKRSLVRQYIYQEVGNIDDSIAFIDVAGSGLTMEYLALSVLSDSTKKINCFYYRMDNAKSNHCRNHVFYPFYVDYFVILEMLCRAPLEQTMGYEKRDKVTPVFGNVDMQDIKKHGIDEFVDGAIAYAKICSLDIEYEYSRDLINSYLRYIKLTPDRETLDFFADMPNMLTGRENHSMAFAPKLSWNDIRNIYWYRGNEPIEQYYYGSDYHYSKLRLEDFEKKLVQCYESFRRNHRRIIGKIAIYGAGKKGKKLYYQIVDDINNGMATDVDKNIIWVDKNYQDYSLEGYPVSAIETLVENNIDLILVAIASFNVFLEVKRELVSMGIEERIIAHFLI